MKTKKPAHGGRRPGAGRPRSANPNVSLRLSLPFSDVLAISTHPQGYKLAREALAAVAFGLRNPDLPPPA